MKPLAQGLRSWSRRHSKQVAALSGADSTGVKSVPPSLVERMQRSTRCRKEEVVVAKLVPCTCGCVCCNLRCVWRVRFSGCRRARRHPWSHPARRLPPSPARPSAIVRVLKEGQAIIGETRSTTRCSPRHPRGDHRRARRHPAALTQAAGGLS